MAILRRLGLMGLLLCAAGCGQSTASLGEQLKSPDPKARLRAVHALEERAHEREAVLPLLTEALRDDDVYVRSEAIRALQKFDPPAREAIPALVALLKDKAPSVRKAAAKALKKIDPTVAAKAGVP
jgi:HEAT repeat protein